MKKKRNKASFKAKAKNPTMAPYEKMPSGLMPKPSDPNRADFALEKLMSGKSRTLRGKIKQSEKRRYA